MLHFIESRMQKYMDTWWEPYKENHPHFKHWWDNGRQNATVLCPDDLLGFSSLLSVYDMANAHSFTKASIGYRTETSLIWKATKTSEKIKLLRPLSYAWCGASYIAGFGDAFYQQYHHDMHIGMGLGDWFIDKADALNHWYKSTKGTIESWWEYEDHWWK